MLIFGIMVLFFNGFCQWLIFTLISISKNHNTSSFIFNNKKLNKKKGGNKVEPSNNLAPLQPL